MRILLFLLFIPVISYCQSSGRDKSFYTSSNCEEKFYFNLYHTPNTTGTQIYQMEATPDSCAIVIGQIRIGAPTDFYDGLISKIDKNGNTVWSVAIDGPWSQTPTDIELLNDGNYIITGALGSDVGYGFFMLKISPNGNQIWRQDYNIPHPGESLGKNIIKENSDGSLHIATQFSQNGLSFSDRLLYIKTDPLGVILFSKFYTPPNPITIMRINDMIIKDEYAYIAGGNLYQSNLAGWVLKIGAGDGNVVWSKYYTFNDGPAEFTNIFSTSGNKLCLLGTDDINPKDTTLIYMLDTAGICLSSKYFQFNTGSPGQSYGCTMASNGDLIFSRYFYRSPTSSSTLTLSRVNPIDGIIYSRDFNQILILPITYQTKISADNSIFVIGNKTHTDGRFLSFFARFSPDGNLGCSYVLNPATFGSGIASPVNLQMTVGNKSYPPILTGTMNPVLYTVTDSLCVTLNRCDTIKIQGQDSICHLQQEYFFTVYRNPGCSVPVNWQISSPAIQTSQQINDTTIKLVFNQSWQGYLYASIENACGILRDSLLLTIMESPGAVDLGEDQVLCQDNTIILNAHSGYASYLWQDNSTDSTLTVTSPGVYWVQVKDACNEIYRDSILISAAIPLPLDLGPDLYKCNSDSLHITAPPNFINYNWSPNYNISNISGQSVTVYPNIDTIYRLAAESSEGCITHDSIRVYVLNSPLINLGADISFCRGDSLTLNAGPGFTSYSWNTGNNSQQIIVNNVGLYSVFATAANGCTSTDSLRVISVYDNPIINLGDDVTICDNEIKRLSAGTGFINYNWSNGSTGSFLDVNTIGEYWVIVTDQNNCESSDTIKITGILPSPKQFLPQDTILCNYSSFSLQAGATFRNYLWNTGSVSSSIFISSPGVYWLQVKAENGCAGRDTINIFPKQCLEGFYIPTAFTPNNDGKNDIFRPLLFGNVIKYEFKIYNRWGEVVFKTNDLQNGWNGFANGTKKDTHIYIWYCAYQFEGQTEQIKKGTFVLIR